MLLLGLCVCLASQFHQASPAQLQSVEAYLSSRLTSYELLPPARLVSRRSLSADALPARHLHFAAFSRQYHLVLRPDYSHARQHPALSAVLIAQNGSWSEFNADSLFDDFYAGYIDDHPDSRVTGYTDRHRLHLTVYEKDSDVLNIEPLSLLTGNQSEDRTLLYYDSNISNTQQYRCGLQDDSSDEAADFDSAASSSRTPRSRRSTEPKDSPPSTPLRVCRLQMVAEHAFVYHVGSVSAGLKFLIKAADDVNAIYLDTVFTTADGKVNFSSISFELSRLVAMTGPSAVPAAEPLHFNAATSDQQASANHLLEAFADFEQNGLDLQEYCLSHLVAFRRLERRLLGLAYQGTPDTVKPGGICSMASPSIYGRGRYLARNVGMTTFSDGLGAAVSTRQATLVMAHELAHNLGAAHDPPAGDCNPGLERGGHFLMHAKAVTGKDINHSRLSACSRKSIAKVLENREAECFSNKTGQVCGNSRREGGEACDAGPTGDSCCDPDCRLRPGAACSDANAACCHGCQLAPAGDVCRRARPLWPCRADATCDGRSTACPMAEATSPLANGTLCLQGLGACADGVCRSRCQLAGKRDCTCPQAADACSQCCEGGPAGEACAVLRNDSMAAWRRPDCPEQLESALIGGTAARLWRQVGRIGGDSLASVLRCNMVFIVVLLSLLVWVPACCIFDYRAQRDSQGATENAVA